MSEPSSNRGRSGTGHFARGWAAKIPEDSAAKPLFQRPWFRRTLFAVACAAGLLAAAGLWRLKELYRQREADFDRQQLHVAVFASSDEFKAFTHAADAQLLAMLNFIVARPDQVHALLPNVAAWEKEHHAMPWTVQLSTLPVSAPPERMLAASRNACGLLAARGFAFDQAQRAPGHRLFVHLLTPYLGQFLKRHPEYDLTGVPTNLRQQEQLFVAYANHFSPPATISDAERLFALYATIGPDMWKTIEQLQPPKAK